MRYRCSVFIFLFLIAPSLVSAEFYKYRDENGVLRFTDNLQEVPESQREGVQQYHETKSSELPGTIEAQGDDSRTEAEKLQAEKALLDNEYKMLLEERKVLEEAAKIARAPAKNEAFEKKILDFNTRLSAYEEKRMLFKAKVDTYNAQVDAQLKTGTLPKSQ